MQMICKSPTFSLRSLNCVEQHFHRTMLPPTASAKDVQFHTSSFPTVIIDVINVYNVYKKIFVNAFIILSTFISIKLHERNEAKL